MTTDNGHKDDYLRLFKTPEHPCSYLPDLTAHTIFVDPSAKKSPGLYQALLDMGFRRSGSDLYRPDCPGCNACLSVRIPVARFTARRSQHRVWKRLQSDLEVRILPARFEQEHFDLYATYMNSRHPDGEMANPTEEDYCKFLICPWSETSFVEFRYERRLFAVAVIDMLPRGMSAVYTFFDPAMSAVSPGVLAILWQIQEARRLDLPWLYLGYWIPDSPKMRYKQDYRPLQIYTDGVWREFSASETITIQKLYG